MAILSISANYLFLTFEYFLAFIFGHMIIMSMIHVMHLKMKDVQINVASMDFWIEVLVNGSGT